MSTSNCVFKIILIISSRLRMSKNVESGLYLAGFSTVSTHSVIANNQPMDRIENYSLFMYLLTPRSRVLHEKLIGFQLVKKFPTFYGNRRFITAFTSARHLSLAISIQSISPSLTPWISILILSFHLRLGLPSGLFPSGLPTKTLYCLLFIMRWNLVSRVRGRNVGSGRSTTGCRGV